MALRLGMVTVDTDDAAGLGAWWAERLGARVSESHGGFYEVVKGGGLPVLLAFQQVDEPTPGRNRLHLDLVADDPDAEVGRLVEAGAEVVARREEGGSAWTVLTDPGGNAFCVGAPDGHDYP